MESYKTGIIVLALITGIIHSYIGISLLPGIFSTYFILMGVGYFVGIILLMTKAKTRWVMAAGILYVIILIALWGELAFKLLGEPHSLALSPLALFDKIVEVILLVLLITSTMRFRQ